jgi:hypothetical protein
MCLKKKKKKCRRNRVERGITELESGVERETEIQRYTMRRRKNK